MDKKTILRSISFGQRVAEEETDVLASYFVETDDWDRLYRGDIDVIYGPKGAGKSALYALLNSRSTELFDRNILMVAGENPRGAPAFRDLAIDPPAGEREFVGFWKLYFASLLHSILSEYGIKNDASKTLEAALAREGLIKGSLSLAGLLRVVVDYARRALRPKALEGTLEIDPVTQLPKGFTGKIVFSESADAVSDPEINSVDKLLSLANTALQQASVKAWILLDRLDVAFAENSELEQNALRALFRVYLDMRGLANISIKIFLRTDIWDRITNEGFREGSHITRHMTISWNRNSLLNLILRRAIHNEAIQKAYTVDAELPKQPARIQETLFYRMCPDQVDLGPNKPKTFDWMLSRTQDGTKSNAPRELIHFLTCLREVQVKRLEIGESDPEGETLFSRPSFKGSSRTRVDEFWPAMRVSGPVDGRKAGFALGGNRLQLRGA